MSENDHWRNWTLEQWQNAFYCEDCGLPMLEIEDEDNKNIGHYQCVYCTWKQDEGDQLRTTARAHEVIIETAHEALTAAGHTAEVDGYIPGAINELAAEVERLREALEDERTDRQQYEAALSAAGVHVRQNKMFEYEVYLRGEA